MLAGIILIPLLLQRDYRYWSFQIGPERPQGFCTCTLEKNLSARAQLSYTICHFFATTEPSYFNAKEMASSASMRGPPRYTARYCFDAKRKREIAVAVPLSRS